MPEARWGGERLLPSFFPVQNDGEPRMRNDRLVVGLASALWIGVIAAGMGMLIDYETGPGPAARPPERWPVASRIARAAGLPTLIVFGHPHCPCTRATIRELAVLAAQARGRFQAHVLLVKPDGLNEEWAKTDLWRSAAEIPGVEVSLDASGREAELFNARTSGQAVLYGDGGRMLFSGGITGSRGHSGDNAGRSAVVSMLLHGRAKTTSTFVFGCSLQDSHDDRIQRWRLPWKI